MRLLITGGSSYLGQHLTPLAAQSHEVLYTYYSTDPLALTCGRPLDIRDATAVDALVQDYQPEAILHLAGSNRGHDYDGVIVQGTRHVVAAAHRVQARVIHLSTDSIFRGDKAPYDETAVPDPVNAYGQAKAAAETIVAVYTNSVIVRTSLIYSLTLMDHGTAWMQQALAAGESVTLFNNQMRNPVWAVTLSQACLELLTLPYTGILNVAGRQVLSRAEFAQKMLNYWQIPQRTAVSIAPSTDNKWPLDCTLDLTKAAVILHTPLWGVNERLPTLPTG
jgi:dTDP-4-dehydrorhamnose reductase